jgi:hypothetical protein
MKSMDGNHHLTKLPLSCKLTLQNHQKVTMFFQAENAHAIKLEQERRSGTS